MIDLYSDENTLDVYVAGLKTSKTGEYIDNAVTTLDIVQDAVSLTGFPLTLTPVGSNGDYEGTITYETPLINKQTYDVELLSISDSSRLNIKNKVKAKTRQSNT